MSINSQSQLNRTEEERRSVFLDALSDESILSNPDTQLGIYSRVLGLRLKKGEVFNLEQLVKIGLPVSAGENLAKHLGMEPKDFFKRFLGMSDSTVRRRFKRDQLSVRESDRVVRYAHLLSLATNLMSGSEEDARTWLSSSVYALGTSTPLEIAVTETGARRVEDLIVALEYGIFS